jgi:hypothetical protein
MEGDFHPARMRGLLASLLDVVFAALVLATLVVAMLTLLSDNARDELARAYARQFALKAETACPTHLGNAFWFACASEVRRINPPASAPPAPAAAATPRTPRPAAAPPRPAGAR